MGYIKQLKIDLQTNNFVKEEYNEDGLTTDDDYDFEFSKQQEKYFQDTDLANNRNKNK